ncbi:hypothetical protein [Streptomyces osmaniensis]|uniref:Uncharacterized protein n=1 Tax=Streptomyces osmaniensis TaxID=593134 RepID=A0ABP6YVN7_9ACTN|nr:hypothetical protein KJK32_46675 [Streptomyces sp. JCM17656]
MTEKIRAPWTPEQVTALNEFQQRGGIHPFTCGGDHAPGSPLLVAYADGWRCPQPYGEACDYRQDWAHAFMADPSAWPLFPFGERHGPTPEEMAATQVPEQVGALQDRLRNAHRERRAKEHQLDGIRRALCDAGFMEDDDPYSHADLADVVRQAGELLDPLLREVAAARKFAGEMRDFCSPHGVATGYADRLIEAMGRAKEAR